MYTEIYACFGASPKTCYRTYVMAVRVRRPSYHISADVGSHAKDVGTLCPWEYTRPTTPYRDIRIFRCEPDDLLPKI